MWLLFFQGCVRIVKTEIGNEQQPSVDESFPSFCILSSKGNKSDYRPQKVDYYIVFRGHNRTTMSI